jgi:hypothetical protein
MDRGRVSAVVLTMGAMPRRERGARGPLGSAPTGCPHCGQEPSLLRDDGLCYYAGKLADLAKGEQLEIPDPDGWEQIDVDGPMPRSNLRSERRSRSRRGTGTVTAMHDGIAAGGVYPRISKPAPRAAVRRDFVFLWRCPIDLATMSPCRGRQSAWR